MNGYPMQQEEQRELPHNVEAEQRLIGALMVNNDCFHSVGAGLEPEHFYEPLHARIWEHSGKLISENKLVSPVTLKADFVDDEGLNELGGASYFVRMAGAAISPRDYKGFADLICELWERRRLIALTTECSDDLYRGGTAAAAVEVVEQGLLDTQASASEPRSMSLLAASVKAINEMNDRFQNGATGVPSGLAALDEITGGFHKAEFTLIGGATSMGKTAFATWVAHAAAKADVGVGFATLEMGESQLYQRINSIDSRIPYQAQRRDMSQSTFRKVLEAAKEQEILPIEMFSSETRTISAIMSEARKLQRKWKPDEGSDKPFRGLGMLIIDYIQLIKGKGNSLEVLAEAANECKSIAKRLDIPVIALAQVDRKIVFRENKVPTLADLRGSGDLEMAADNVIFCYRPEYYLVRDLQNPAMSTGDRADSEAALALSRNTMDLIVAKQRMGVVDQCRVGCDMGVNRFWDMPKQHEVEF